MNIERRATAKVCIALLTESANFGGMEDHSYVALQEAVKTMQSQEYWQLRNQSRFEGQNKPTDKQIAICRVALPALETAVAQLALDDPDFDLVIEQLTLAVETEGEAPEPATPRGRKKR